MAPLGVHDVIQNGRRDGCHLISYALKMLDNILLKLFLILYSTSVE